MAFSEKNKTVTLPILPISESVVFPGISCSFDIPYAAYTSISEKINDVGGKLFITAFKNSENNIKGREADLFSFGTVVRFVSIDVKADNLVGITIEGICRGEMVGFSKHDPLCVNVIYRYDAQVHDHVKEAELSNSLMLLTQQYLKNIHDYSQEVKERIKKCKTLVELTDIVCALLIIKFEDKQDILEETNPIRRAELLIFKLDLQLRLLSNDVRIHRKVKDRLDEAQRKFFMREQLKVIREELGEDDEDSYDGDYQEYITKIMASPLLTDEVAEKLIKEAAKLTKLPYGSAERAVIMSYLDVCLEIPFSKTTRDKVNTVSARKILDKDHYGLEKVKERIIEYLAVMKMTQGIKSQIICLVGAPGVGKTSVAASLARAMGKRFTRVALGGVRDEADIRGHRKTYIGSMPGRVVKALIEAGVSNPVILFDEVDKLANDVRGDPASALLEVLDPDQNKAFRDHFVEIPIDLSGCFFICTANTTETIPKPLLDRMEVIELNSYTREEKLEIAKNYLVPKQIKQHGFTKKTMSFKDEALYEIIDRYTLEAGVRNLERAIAKICRKAAKACVEGVQNSFKIKSEDVFIYLGERKYEDERAMNEDSVGIVNGLAYTEAGGALLSVEAALMKGSGKLELTGSLGEVMKESAKIAYSIVRARTEELGITEEFYKNSDIHIHFPEGATPKDGPSAGVTLVTVLVSVLTGKKVRCDVAMTGEVTLSGRVIAIGGLREKVTAARRAGIKKIFIPYDNRQDLSALDTYIKEGIEFRLCKNVNEVIEGAVISPSKIQLTSGFLPSERVNVPLTDREKGRTIRNNP